MSHKLLIDSHVVIWLLFEPERITKSCEQHLLMAAERYVSAASIWELALKHKRGKLVYSPQKILAGCEESGLQLLDISAKHILSTSGIRLNHKDPFDEMLTAQARVEHLAILTADQLILSSPYKTIDARV